MKVKNEFLCFGTFLIKNGSQVRFWEDTWLGNSTLREQYPSLYNIARHKQDTIVEVFSTSPLNISWRRDLIGCKLTAWNDLVPRLANIVLNQESDEFQWNLHTNGQFLVKSHYLAMIHSDIPNLNKHLWKLKAPLKIKIFMWYLQRGVILTKDNLAKRSWQGSKVCYFCHKDETIQHLFFECRFPQAVWSMIHADLGLSQPRSVSNIFGSWLWGLEKDLKPLILLGVAATCWPLWLCRNDIIFRNKHNTFPL
jgi:hypothetical protein